MIFVRQFFKGKEDIKAEDIELFVSQKIEENVKLDYTDIKAYNDADGLSVSIASFANSEGGLIILGVSEDKIVDERGKIKRIYPK
jgi:predicted HTH transcriptional regulator